jgi:hypothetical protein
MTINLDDGFFSFVPVFFEERKAIGVSRGFCACLVIGRKDWFDEKIGRRRHLRQSDALNPSTF